MGYFDDTCFARPPCPAPYVVPGINKTFTVLNEAALLALTQGEMSVGDDIIIILSTSRTIAYGVVKFVNSGGSGWAQFTVVGNPSTTIITPASFSAFVNSLPLAPPVGGGPWNNGGSPTQS
jgi:hypothetical protein